ncbi:ABC transporter ATP-binding protein [Lacticaseibacillus chiayiensis]|uniref:ABC transporter ATP-binding protein n=1 Tax=Lacticaseibacillus chiayiensis TaxID=2100821 RepID=UPI0013049070|nr:ABC transporter ATP-binding protein [Lacticaseibacillus chiayiensis]
MKEFKKYDRVSFFMAFIFSGIIYPFINLLLALVLKRLIDAGVARNVGRLKTAILLCLMVCIFLAVAVFVSTLTKNKFVNSFSKGYRKTIFDKITEANLNEFTRNRIGDFISLMTTTISTIEEKYVKIYFDLLSNLALLVFSIFGMFTINWELSLAVLLVSILPMFAMGFLGGNIQRKQGTVLASENGYVSKVKDALSGFLIIKSFSNEKQVSREFKQSNDKRADSQFAMSETNNISVSISNFSGYLIFLVAYGLGMFMVIHDRVSIGGVTAIVQLVNFVVMPMSKLGLEMNNRKAGISAIEKVNNFKERIDVSNQTNANLLEVSDFKSDIELHDVNFSYPDQTGNAKRVLKNINLRLEKGKKYALVGMSGSGKSTLLKLLMKYYQVEKPGEVLVDNVNINKIKLSSLYKLITIVQQDVYIFDNSLGYNITLGKHFTDEELNFAINKSGLRKLVNNSDDGMQLITGEGGNKLSGGQKQRISIARALIRKTPILLMDEATSSLDQQNTTEIEKGILEIDGLTSVVITHKINADLLKKYDSIIFMKNGMISEHGKFNDLMNKKGDLYNLYKLAINE